MSRAADDAGLPADPEFRAALVSYLEWGTRLAMGNSQPGATPPEHAPVPRWGWGVAPPYLP
jgi:hemoglobin